MSTVFKLKAAILMVCAFVVVSVSTAWGQGGLEPKPEFGTAAQFQSDSDVNWVIRGDNADGVEKNTRIGIYCKKVETETQQYALFLVDGDKVKFIEPSIVNVVEGSNPGRFYYNGDDFLYDNGKVGIHYGYDGNFKPTNITPKGTLTNVLCDGIMNNYALKDIIHSGTAEFDGVTPKKRATYTLKNQKN